MVTTPRLTYQDYAALEGDERYELLDGRLVPVPSRNTAHQTVSIRLMTEMYFFVEENGLGRLYPAPFDVLFTDFDVVQPDLLLICGNREHIITPDNVQGAPDLIVEVLSPSTSRMDWRDKRELYALHGVREYWIVDPTHRIVSILQLRNDVLEITQICTEGDAVESTVLEGFSVSLAELSKSNHPCGPRSDDAVRSSRHLPVPPWPTDQVGGTTAQRQPSLSRLSRQSPFVASNNAPLERH